MSATSVPRAPRPPKPPLDRFVALGVMAAVVLTVLSAWYVGATVVPLWERWDQVWQVVEPALHPAWGYVTDPGSRLWVALRETLAIAVVASAIACPAALGVALLASPVSAPPAVHRLVRPVMAMVRSLPDLAWALIFVAVVIGPLPGILALVVFDVGIVAKLTSESIDAVDHGPIEALDAAGASRWQRARAAIVPLVLPQYASYCLYVLELNVRAALVLGVVGAGGVGQLMMLHFSRFEWRHLSALVVVMFVVVVAIDLVSHAVRRRLR
jgi:phosphonate transport system permease protein